MPRPMSRPRPWSAAAATGAGVALALTALPGTSAPAGATPPERSCELVDAQIASAATPAADLTELFTDYADTGAGWTGGDSTYSIPLRDGRDVWVFSDTFLGPVNADGTRPESAPFINNSFVVQEGTELSTAHGGTAEEPEALLPPPEEPGWFWVGDGLQRRDGVIQLMALQYWDGGGGMWDFGWDSNHLATFDPDSFELLDLVDLPSATGVQWASWIEPAGQYTYIYGVEDQGERKYMHVARVVGSDLSRPWKFWDGRRWSPHESSSARVMDGVANEYSVAAFADGYLLITQDTHEEFSATINAYVACSPAGPFELVGEVAQMPEVGAAGSYGDPNIFAYNAHEHPELRAEDSLTISYNVNSFDSEDLYEDVTIYRPRFVTIDLDIVRPDSEPCAHGLGGGNGQGHGHRPGPGGPGHC
ncbi:DUF4185 domain-containing protein [Ruania albidiflava]|uniref:DUF4185 domain-containing protein n=1 Tax=Ruania albidiflava TaxID=366586 RepID=UPI0023F2ADEA|nr:DUF4185 domain-containing protein [Ruania albidiflava]